MRTSLTALIAPGVAFLAASLATPAATTSAAENETPTNVVWILTDNHGPWTLGCYGNEDIRTPNIDRLAAEGVKFTEAYACNAVCSPTRASYLTGRMPSQHGVHRYLGAGRLQVGPRARSTIESLPNLPSILSDAGYSCGLVGKWHLGDNLRPQCGLDDYWVTTPHGGTRTFYDARVIRDGEIEREPQYLTDYWTDHAVEYLRENRDRPFFLMLAYNGPYGLGSSLSRPARNRHADFYRDHPLPSFPRETVFPWQWRNRRFINHQPAMARYAAEVSGIDDGVGRVMETLAELGLDERTLVIFTADQGLGGGQHGLWGMGDHTRPLHAFDPTMHIPLIVRHKNRLDPGRAVDSLVSNYDFLPTVLSYLGMADQTPDQIPGRDYTPLLRGEPTDWQDEVFYEFENTRAVRTRRWKLVRRFEDPYNELYDLAADPGERENRFGDPKLTEIQQRLEQRLNEFFEVHNDPQYDLWNGGGSQTQLIGFRESENDRVLAPKAFDPGYRGADLSVPDGYVVELAAAPPLVNHPTMADVDQQGRLVVAESSGKNLRAEELLSEQPGRILMLEDLNDDGQYDTSQVFADNLTLPQGVLCHRGAVYVCSPPSLLRFEDTDGDGRADQRDVLVDGFGFTGNAASVHGPFLAPSGRLFICQGRKPHELRDGEEKLVNVGAAARIWSCRLDGTDLREHCGGGMDNPVEVDFTDDGQVLGTVNLLHAGPRDDALVHWIKGGVYPRSDQQASLQEFSATGPLLNMGVHFGHIAVSGTTRYRGDAMGPRMRDRWLVTEFNRGHLLRVTLEPQGASFGGEFETFLTSASDAFHPTDVLQDARGDLLLVDTGGWFRIACPSSRYARPELLGAIYRIRPSGAVRSRADFTVEGNRDTKVTQAIERLRSSDPVVRRASVDPLGRAGDVALPKLRAVWPKLGKAARIQAVWAICRVGSPNAMEQLISVAGDSAEPAKVRTAALGALAAHRPESAWSVAGQAVAEPDPALARQAAALMSELAEGDSRDLESPSVRQAAEAAWRRLDSAAGDAALEHQLIDALMRLGATELTAEGLQPDQPPVRARAAMVVMRASDQQPAVADGLRWLASSDRSTRAVAAEIVAARDGASEAFARWVADHVAGRDFGRTGDSSQASLPRTELLQVLAQQIDEEPLVPVVARWLGAKDDPALQRLTVDAIAAGPRQPLPPSWKQPIVRLLEESQPSELRIGAIAALDRLETNEPVAKRLRAIGRDEAEPLDIRIAAWRAAAGAGLPEEGFSLLLDQLDPTKLSPERRQAASILGQTRLSPSQLERLAKEALLDLHPLDLPVVIEAFAGLRRAGVGRALLESLAAAPGRTNLSVEQFDRVMRRYPGPVQRAADPLREELKLAQQERLERLNTLRQSLPSGDAERGQAVFRSEKASCAACHRAGEKGKRIGPDLSEIGKIRSVDDLLESIVLPSATIARDYETHQVLSIDGRIIAGLVQRQSDGSVQVTGADAKPVNLSADEIEAIQPSPVSVMPTGLDKELTEQQLSDLIAYLRSLQGDGSSSQ